MAVYSIDCYYPEGMEVDPPYDAVGCFVDDRKNRVLSNEKFTQSPMSAVVSNVHSSPVATKKVAYRMMAFVVTRQR